MISAINMQIEQMSPQMPILSFAKLGYCFVKQPDMIPLEEMHLLTQ